MDSLPQSERMWFDSTLNEKLQFLYGEPFQDFFWSAMKENHGDDFQCPTAYGSYGDLASDGYIMSASHCFQCYAPKTFRESRARSKMRDDVQRAIEKWPNMKKWTFVLNADGVPAPLVQELTTLREKHNLEMVIWERRDLLALFGSFHRPALERLLGRSHPMARMEFLTRQTIASVLGRIEPSTASLDSLTNPTPGKLRYNEVGEAWHFQLKVGMAGAPQVREFFLSAADGELGSRTAAAMHVEYALLRNAGSTADGCLDALANTLEGTGTGKSSETHAIFAVLAYFFETCDILEPEPPS